MALADWLAAGAEPAKLTPEEVRRQTNLLAVREEQAAAHLESSLEQQEVMFRKGAATTSPVLRRVLARRHRRLGNQIKLLERDLSRVSKELAGLEMVQRLLRDGTALASPGDCTPLLRVLDDADVPEEDFAEQLARSLRAGKVAEPTGPINAATSELMIVWSKMDRGDISSAEEGLKHLHGG